MDKLLERIYDDKRKKVINNLSYKKSKSIRVIPVPQSGGWMPRNTEGDVLKNRAKVRFTAPYNTRSKMYIDPLSHLSNEQKDELAKELGLEDRHSLNPLKPEHENYWRNKEVILDGNGLVLDTSNPAHYVDICILLANYETISPSWESRKDKATYMFAVVDGEEETKGKKERSKTNSQAFKLFFDIEKSTDKLESVLWIRYWEKKNYPQPPEKPNRDWLYSEVEEMVHDSPKDFIDIVGDGKFEVKATIVKALKYGVLKRKGQNYMFASADTPIGTFGETAEYFADENNQDEYMKLTDQLEKKTKSKK